MSVLRNLESKIAGLVEGTFGRVFKTEVRPVELARKLAREMDEHKTVSLKRTYVPNEYVIWLSPEDRERYEGMEQEVRRRARRAPARARAPREVRAGLPPADRVEHRRAPRPRASSASRRGSSGPPARRRAASSRPSTATRWSTRPPSACRSRLAGAARRAPRPRVRPRRGQAPAGPRGRRGDRPLAATATSCCGDTNVSRHHAEIRPAGSGWTVADLGSTNGVRVNGRASPAPCRCAPATALELGTVPHDLRGRVMPWPSTPSPSR